MPDRSSNLLPFATALVMILGLMSGLVLILTGGGTAVKIGGVLTVAAMLSLVVAMGVAVWEGARLRRRRREHRCLRCGYPRHGRDDYEPCPECGTTWHSEHPRRTRA